MVGQRVTWHAGCADPTEPWEQLFQSASDKLPFLTGPIHVTALCGDGSDRRFYRARQGTIHVILLISPRRKVDAVDENDSYYRIGRHLLERSIPVPHILWADPSKGWFVLEDLGDSHFQHVVGRGRAERRELYRKALALLLRMHQLAPDGFSRDFCFDGPLYDPEFVRTRELDYFQDAFMGRLLGRPELSSALERDFDKLATSAGVVDPRWIIHRDFQSRNLMVWRGALRLIDFQGMRHGPPAYDLASLLIDPYVGLTAEEERALVSRYWSGASKFLGCSRQSFRASYEAVRLCRNLQALAAYAFLSLVKGKRSFGRYIRPAWGRLRQSLSEESTRRRYPALVQWVQGVSPDILRCRLKEHGLGWMGRSFS